MKFRENKKINNSRTTRALFRVNGVSIDYLEMDYKRRLCLSCSPEAQNKIIADFYLYLNSCFRQVFAKMYVQELKLHKLCIMHYITI